METPAYRKKICLLGPGGVGKTSLTRRYVESRFSEDYQTTLGAAVVKKTVQVRRWKRQPAPVQAWQSQYPQAGFQLPVPQQEVEDVTLHLQIWDIMGQAHPERLQAAFYEGAEGALLVADCSRPETIGELDIWAQNLYRVVRREVPVIMLGNKKDLVPPESLSEVEQLLQQTAARHRAQHFATSAKTGEGVDISFYNLGYLMVA